MAFRAPPSPIELRNNELERPLRLRQHEPGLEPEHPKPELSEPPVTAPISPATPSVESAVNFHDEPCSRRKEINDDPRDDDLTPKGDAKL